MVTEILEQEVETPDLGARTMGDHFAHCEYDQRPAPNKDSGVSLWPVIYLTAITAAAALAALYAASPSWNQ